MNWSVAWELAKKYGPSIISSVLVTAGVVRYSPPVRNLLSPPVAPAVEQPAAAPIDCRPGLSKQDMIEVLDAVRRIPPFRNEITVTNRIPDKPSPAR